MEQFALAQPLYRAFTHAHSAPSLAKLVPRIAPRPVLLISSGLKYERDMNRAYKSRAGAGTQLWEIPDAPHTGGLKTHPVSYEQRVSTFFHKAFGPAK
jgi:hypothetical protein